MDINNIDVNRVMQQMKDKKVYLDSLTKSHGENLSEQCRIFRQYVEKLQPVLNFLKESRHYFKSPSVTDYATARGPILAHDKKENILFVFDLENKMVRKINLYNSEEKGSTFLERFLEEYSFENAIKGLLYCLEIQDEVIRTYQTAIDEQESLINKYKIV